MISAVYKSKNKLVIETRPIPKIIFPKDIIVKITLSSICTSDFHIIAGCVPKAKENIILGHEFVGIVYEIGKDIKNFTIGERVAGNCETFCGECFFCKRGYVNNCQKGGWLIGCQIDGCHSEFIRVPYGDKVLNKIPDNVSDEKALFVGDILHTGYWGAEIAEIKSNEICAIIGAGPVGILTALCAKKIFGAKIVLIEKNVNRITFAKDIFEENDIVISNTEAKNVILELTENRGADCVIECAGGEDTFQFAIDIARPNAIISVVAMYEKNQILPLPNMYGKNLIFKTGGVDAGKMDKILQLIENNIIDPSFLIGKIYPLNQIKEAYDEFSKGKYMKVAIKQKE